MQIEDWPLTKVRPYPNNPRVLRNAAEKVAESIKAFGWRQPIVVDETGEIIVGHSRHAAAQLLKLKTVPVHVATGLSQDQVRALRIADNKTATFAGWDEDKLADELAAIMAGLGDVSATGFSQAEFDAIEMKARAELEQITGAGAAAAPEAPATAPIEGEEGDGLDDGEDLDPDQLAAGSGDTPPPAPDMVPFNALLTVEARQVVFDAINRAKETHGLQQSGDALLVIARGYLNA